MHLLTTLILGCITMMSINERWIANPKPLFLQSSLNSSVRFTSAGRVYSTSISFLSLQKNKNKKSHTKISSFTTIAYTCKIIYPKCPRPLNAISWLRQMMFQIVGCRWFSTEMFCPNPEMKRRRRSSWQRMAGKRGYVLYISWNNRIISYSG